METKHVVKRQTSTIFFCDYSNTANLLSENANYKLPVKMLSNYQWEVDDDSLWRQKGTQHLWNLQDKPNNAETFNIFSNINGLSWPLHGGMQPGPLSLVESFIVMLRQLSYAIRDSWLPCTERSYNRRNNSSDITSTSRWTSLYSIQQWSSTLILKCPRLTFYWCGVPRLW